MLQDEENKLTVRPLVSPEESMKEGKNKSAIAIR